MIAICNKWLGFKGHEDKPVRGVRNPLEMVKNGKENYRRKFVKLMIENCERVLKERHEA